MLHCSEPLPLYSPGPIKRPRDTPPTIDLPLPTACKRAKKDLSDNKHLPKAEFDQHHKPRLQRLITTNTQDPRMWNTHIQHAAANLCTQDHNLLHLINNLNNRNLTIAGFYRNVLFITITTKSIPQDSPNLPRLHQTLEMLNSPWSLYLQTHLLCKHHSINKETLSSPLFKIKAWIQENPLLDQSLLPYKTLALLLQYKHLTPPLLEKEDLQPLIANNLKSIICSNTHPKTREEATRLCSLFLNYNLITFPKNSISTDSILQLLKHANPSLQLHLTSLFLIMTKQDIITKDTINDPNLKNYLHSLFQQGYFTKEHKYCWIDITLFCLHSLCKQKFQITLLSNQEYNTLSHWIKIHSSSLPQFLQNHLKTLTQKE